MPDRILVVDDEESIIQLITYNLERAGYEVVSAETGPEALAMLRQAAPDLIILDVMLPGMDGLEVCKAVRKESDTPIIMLTALDSEIDRVVGFEIGADDFVTKPFSPRELVGRVKAILRRTKPPRGEPAQDREHLTVGPVSINFTAYEVTLEGKPVTLTPTEFQILKALAVSPGRVLTRQMLVDQTMGHDYDGDLRTIDVHIRHLRSKLAQDPTSPQIVETVRGVGYKLSGTKRS